MSKNKYVSFALTREAAEDRLPGLILLLREPLAVVPHGDYFAIVRVLP